MGDDSSTRPGPRVLITAGPTHEPLDPVRFLGNRSSGRMGYALAAAAVQAGAQVSLVSGPVALVAPEGLMELVEIESAAELAAAVRARVSGAEIIICAAAVADWTPAQVADQKLKKEAQGERWTVELRRTVDVLGSLRGWGFGGFLVGFAAETEHLAANAREKLVRKGCDLVVANDVSRADIGFAGADNELHLFWRDQAEPELLEKAGKVELAAELWRRIGQRLG